jgi:hypothetical protein
LRRISTKNFSEIFVLGIRFDAQMLSAGSTDWIRRTRIRTCETRDWQELDQMFPEVTGQIES